MEGFCEQVVKVKRGAKQYAFTIIVPLLFILPVIFFMYGFYVTLDYFYALFALIISMAGVLICWITIPRVNNVDFDYAVLGSNLGIDKVTGRNSRKKKLRVEIKNIEKLEKLSDKTVLARKYAKKYDFTGGAELDKVYFAEFRVPDVGLCMMLFCPNEKILEGMRPMLRHDIIRSLFYGRK